MKTKLSPALAVLALLLGAAGAQADDAAIRKALAERMPNLPKIDEIQKTAIPGLYEVRLGAEIIYADEQGQYLVFGELFDTKSRANLTQARIEKLTAFEFAKLPLKDSIPIKQGSGARKMAVFVDPNCGYCKRFERDLAALKNVTIYTFLYPILGPDSNTKSRDIWCAKDPGKAWRDWMIGEKLPPSVGDAKCDADALGRNVALGQKHRVQGTPAAVFEDGSRLPGAVPLDRLEQQLAKSSRS